VCAGNGGCERDILMADGRDSNVIFRCGSEIDAENAFLVRRTE
jgi:hypothetical protein